MTANYPDFDSYLYGPAITSVEALQREVKVLWDDGLVSRYHVFWLRENASDEDTLHPITKEQRLQLTDIPDNLEATSAAADKAVLTVEWNDGTSSCFDAGWLRAHSLGDQSEHHDLPDRVLWNGELELPTYQADKIALDQAQFDAFILSLYQFGVARVTGLGSQQSVPPALCLSTCLANYDNV